MSINKITSCWIILLLIVVTILSGCSGESCIEADDFGHAEIKISSRYLKKDFFPNQNEKDQVAPWRDSSYRVNGRPLTVVVRGWQYPTDPNTPDLLSAWCAWNGRSSDSNKLSLFCERLQDCQFYGDNGGTCSKGNKALIGNAPCLFRNGIGLYALIATKGTNPNQNISTQRAPNGLSFHVGAPTAGYSMYETDKNGNVRIVGGRVYDYESDLIKSEYADAQLYFKILDKFYDDNNGQYRVIIKSGITQSSPDPISYVTNLVKTFLFGVDNDYGLIRNIFMGIINQPGYRMAVSALLTLYIMFTGLSYLSGNLQITQTELVTRVVKIAIVSALLSSQYSWSFFHDYLFVYFIGGVEQILQIITEAGATGPGSPGILAMMIAPQTIYKLLSLLFIDWLGFIYIILFFMALYFVVMVFFEAAVIYLTALIAIGMIIIMGPIFICFILFDITKSLFENWLKQLFSYALQPVILFTGLIFISMILRQEIYGSLGFRVCKESFPDMGDSNGENKSFFAERTKGHIEEKLSNSIFYWWFPSPGKGEDFSRNLVKIPVPIDHFTTDNSVTGAVSDNGFCEAYGCIERRYLDLPFLDPNSSRDRQRLTQFWNGKFVQLDGMLLIMIAIYLLRKFNGLAVSTSRFLTGTSGNLTNLNNVGGAIHAQTFGKASNLSMRAFDTVIGRGNREIGRLKRQNMVKAITEAPSRAVDNLRINGIFGKGGLKSEALSKNPNKAVLAEMRKKGGPEKGKLTTKDITNYKKSLAEKLKTLGYTDKESAKLAKQLAKKDPSQLNNELSKAKFGKKYDKLSEQERGEIDGLNDKALNDQARQAVKAKEFQKAYVEAYASLSDRGIGIAGKNNKTIRSLQEIKNSRKVTEKWRHDTSASVARAIYSGIDYVKAGAYKVAGLKDSRHEHDGSSKNYIDPDRTNYTKQSYYESHNTAERTLVQSKLAQGEDPAFRGETYMSNYAKDSEMEHMIDRAYEVQQNIFYEDEMISKESEYAQNYESAMSDIESAYRVLGENRDMSGVEPEQLPPLLEAHYANDQNRGPGEIEKLNKALADFTENQQKLKQIEEKKAQIADEISEHVDNINKHRKDAGMDEYTPDAPSLGRRQIKDLRDLIPRTNNE